MLALAGVLCGLGEACAADSDGFECSNDDACVAAGIAGVCQPNNYCSFPDPGCESEQRYAEHAPAGFAEECVPADVVSSGSGSDTSADPSADPSDSTEQAEVPPCIDVELGSELGSVDVRTLAGRGDDFAPSCASDTGPDVAYWWTAPVPGDFDFTVDGGVSLTDVTIQLHDACDSELRCGEGLANPWLATVRHSLEQGESVIIVVDGGDEDDGMFELSIALVTE